MGRFHNFTFLVFEYLEGKPLRDEITEAGALSLPAAYADEYREALKEKVARQGDLAWQLARLETEWLELSEALEGLAGG